MALKRPVSVALVRLMLTVCADVGDAEQVIHISNIVNKSLDLSCCISTISLVSNSVIDNKVNNSFFKV